MSKLTAKSQYDNPYEVVYNMLKNDKNFMQEDWDLFARRGELDNYIGVMQSADKLPENFAQQFSFDKLDTDSRFSAMANELWGNKEELKKREEYFYNEEIGKEDKRTFEMSDYDYTNYLLKQKIHYEQEKIIRQENKERKDNMNPFLKFLGSAGAVLITEPLLGLTEITQDLISVFEGVYDGFENMTKGGSFGDGFRNAFDTTKKGSSDWRFLDEWGMTDAIMEWEKNYTDIRDLDGNYTTVGKYLGGVANSLGKAVPMIGLNLISAGTAGTGTALAATLSKVATGIYFTGLGAGSFRELASNPEFASVPTTMLIANASIKTGVEYLIMKGISKAFGPTQLDKLMYGQVTTKVASITGKSALKRIATDFLSEGIEETLQQYSNFVVDSFFALGEQKFATNSEWNLQTMFDAFVIGGLSTIGGNVMSVGKSIIKDTHLKNVAKGIEKKVSNNTATKEEVAKLLEIHESPKMNALASWQYKNTLGDLSSEYAKIMKNKKLSDSDRERALGQMYATMRTLADVYGDLGETRFVAAEKMLQEMQSYKTKDAQQIKAKFIMKMVNELKLDRVVVRLEKEITDAKMTESKVVIKRDNIDDALSIFSAESKNKIAQTIEDIYKSNEKIDTIVITTDGVNVVGMENILFVPLELITADEHGAMIIKSNAERTLVREVAKAKLLEEVITDLRKTFEEITNRSDVSTDEVLYNLFFNDSFLRIVLLGANKNVYQLISHLDVIEKSIKIERDAAYKKKIKEAKARLGIALAQYLIMQQHADYNDITILSKEQKDFVTRHRYGKNLATRVLKGEVLSVEDVTLLKARVNSAPLSADEKIDIAKGLGFIAKEDGFWYKSTSTQNGRAMSLLKLNRIYENFFLSPYDNIRYLKNDTLSNRTFNEFLFEKGLRLTDVLDTDKVSEDTKGYIVENYGKFDGDTLLLYRQDTFQQETGGAFTFTITNKKIAVKELMPKNYKGFKRYQENRNNILSGKNIENVNDESGRQNVNVKDGRKELEALISKDVDNVSRSYLTLTDVINEPELLTRKIKKDIKDIYGELTAENAFLYLRNMTLDKDGTTSIVVRQNGTYTFVDIRPMIHLLKDSNSKVSKDMIGKQERGNIKNFIAKEYLPNGSRLEDILVIDNGKNGTYYEAVSNTIYLGDDNDNNYLRFSLLHEFQHAIQIENNLNTGLSADWLYSLDGKNKIHFKTGLNDNENRNLIEDVRSHVPYLFEGIIRGTVRETEIVNNFVYDTSGESQAYGTEGGMIVQFYPTLISDIGSGIEITLPWGSKYNIMSLSKKQSVTESDSNNRMDIKKPIEFDTDLGESPKSNRKRITKNDTDEAVVLKPFRSKLLSDELRNFIVYADLAALDIRIVDKIKDGTLTIRDLHNIIRTEESVNDYTFKLINKHIYKNEYIKSMTQLRALTDRDVSDYFAIYKILTSKGADISLYTQKKFVEFMDMLETLDNNSAFKNAFDTFSEKFLTEGIDINRGNMRVAFMKMFDGSIDSAGRIADMARKASISGIGNRSSTDVKTTQDGLNDNTMAIADKQDIFNDILISSGRVEKEMIVRKYKLETFRDRHKEVTSKEILAYNRKLSETFEVTSDSALDAYIKKHTLAEIYDEYVIDEQIETQEKPVERKLESIQGNIKRYAVRIRNEMSTANWKKIPQELRDLFDDDFKLKQSTYDTRSLIDHEASKEASKSTLDGEKIIYKQIGVSREQLLELENTLREFNKSIKSGIAKSKTLHVLTERLEKMKALYEKERAKNLGRKDNLIPKNRVKERVVILNDHEFDLISDIDMPEVLNEILNTSFDKFSKAETQFLTGAHSLKLSIEDMIGDKLIKITDNGKRDTSDIDYMVNVLVQSTIDYKKITQDSFIAIIRNEKHGDRFNKITNEEIKDIYYLYSSKIEEQIENGDKNMQMNLTKFLETNGVRLSSLVQEEVDKILEFYSGAILTGRLTRDNIRKYDAFQIYILSYILDQSRQGQWVLNSTQVKNIEMTLELMASNAGTTLAVWRSVLNMVNPNKVIIKSIAKSCDIYLRDDDVDDISDAMKKGDVEKVMELQQDMLRHALMDHEYGYQEVINNVLLEIKELKTKKIKLEKSLNKQKEITEIKNRITLLEQNKKKIENDFANAKAEITELEKNKNSVTDKKRKDELEIELKKKKTHTYGLKGRKNIWDKLWSFQRLAMLSGPGTWVRNHVSNALVTLGNNASSFLANLFLKNKRYKKDQYRIYNTKINDKTYKFVESNFISNGFLDSIMGGLSKYDIRVSKSDKKTSVDIATDMVAQAVKNDVLGIAGKASKFVLKMLSDDAWIKSRVKSYLGKMLVEDGVDLSKGMSHEVLITLAEAFKLACFDYMRKPNIFTKIEQEIKERGGSGAFFGYKMILPFASASWNWFKESLNYTPLGLIKAIVDFARLENTIEKLDEAREKGDNVLSSRFAEYIARRNIGKGIIGSIGFGIGLLLGMLGIAYIDDDDDKIKLSVGDGSVSLDISSIFGSQSILLGIVVTGKAREENNFERYMRDVFNTLSEDSLLSDMYNTFKWNQDLGQMLLDQPNRLLSSFIPNFFKTATALSHNYKIQYSPGILGKYERTFIQGIPGLAYAMPKKYDPYTGELQTKFRVPFLIEAINKFTPIKLYDLGMSDVEKEAVAQGVKQNELSGNYDDIGKLSPKDIDSLNKKYGSLNAQSLKELQLSKDKFSVQMTDGSYKKLMYSQMSQEQKKRVIERIMSKNALYAKIFIYTSNGGKYYANSTDFKLLKNLDIIENVFRATSKLEGFDV